ncbi:MULTISPECIES: iron transporter [Halorussus]|uniref:iron transporter n=1 Tax=Halorussus TaxID=1070314 RepID=UPI000E20F99A|nr:MULTISPECIES: iron transporter [Halorussus]NHN58962.1 fe2+ transport protein [Halorussus sp. JP-T4]
MRRREYLALGTALASGVGAVAARSTGASDGGPQETGTTRATTATGGEKTAGEQRTTTRAERPDGVYVQSFIETMSMQGTARAGDYEVAVMYTIPHVFWTVTGSELSRHARRESDSVHLMAVVWDPETGTVLPEAGVSLEIRRGDSLVSQEVIYPMLSQRMGAHYGANFQLPGDGTYTVKVSIGGMSIPRTGAFSGKFGEGASATVELAFNEQTRSQITIRQVEQAYQPGAVRPMQMGSFPIGRAPKKGQLPGTVAGTATSDDAKLVVTRLTADQAGPLADGRPYLAVSVRTPYNRLVLPMMGLEATVTRGNRTVYDGRLRRTLDPRLNYHYGAPVGSLQSGDQVSIRPTVPPQVARHEGYETAFLQMGEASVTL